MSATAWLTATAREYHRSAGRLERMGKGADGGGLTGEQWAIVYRAIASELHRCAAAVQLPEIPVDVGPGPFCSHVELGLFCVLFPDHEGPHECRGEFAGDW